MRRCPAGASGADTDGDGRLTEADLRRYLKRVLPQMRPLAPLLAPEDRGRCCQEISTDGIEARAPSRVGLKLSWGDTPELLA